MSNGILYIARHGESEWNTLGKWTGITDVSITEKGYDDAKKVGQAFLSDVDIDVVFTSDLKRTHQTLDAMMEGAGKAIRADDAGVVKAKALQERDYGVYTGKDKWQVQREVAPEVFYGIRRGWDYPIPEGENLKQVYERVRPYFETEILPLLKQGKQVLVVAHGNSIRALIKHLEGLSDEAIADVEMPLGHLLVYTFGADGAVVGKQDKSVDVGETKA